MSAYNHQPKKEQDPSAQIEVMADDESRAPDLPKVLADVAERNPEVNRVIEGLESAAKEIAAAFGLDERHFDAHQFAVESLRYDLGRPSYHDDRDRLEESPDTFASMYLIHYATEIGATLETWFPGLNVDGMLKNYYENSYSGLVERCSTTIGPDTMAGIYDTATEIRREGETYQPKSSLVTADSLETLTTGELSTNKLFSYPSVLEGDVAGREMQNKSSHSAQAYGYELKQTVSEYGGERIADLVRGAGSEVCSTLEAASIEPSDWTLDGTWVAWDIGKSGYYAKHPEEQQRHQRRDSFIDRIHYQPLSLDERRRDVTVHALAHRQVGWEVARNAQSKVAGELVAHLSSMSSEEHREVARKLMDARDGQDVHFKSSELSEIGSVLNRLLREKQSS